MFFSCLEARIMPFTKIAEGKNKGKYVSPSGRVYTLKQVRAYHATGGWNRPVRKKENRE